MVTNRVGREVKIRLRLPYKSDLISFLAGSVLVFRHK